MIKKVDIRDIDQAMDIISDAIELLKGISSQWQNGYPNIDVIKNDINNEQLYGEYLDHKLVSICAIVKGIDKNYLKIEGKWISDVGDRDLVVHRIAVRNGYHNKKLGDNLIKFAIEKAKSEHFKCVRIDTHRSNIAMQKIINDNGFKYCGKVWVTSDAVDNERLAFEYYIG